MQQVLVGKSLRKYKNKTSRNDTESHNIII
jgi:hypothetical protein